MKERPLVKPILETLSEIEISPPRGITGVDPSRHIKILRHNINSQLRDAPHLYLYYAAYYSKICDMVERYEAKLAHLEAELSIGLSKEFKGRRRVSDIKALYYGSKQYRVLKVKLRKWKSLERMFKYIERSFDKRTETLRSINANVRREQSEYEQGE
jgi:hypothetical protein